MPRQHSAPQGHQTQSARSRSPCADLGEASMHCLQMASTLRATGHQGRALFEDLAVYFSQEECVGVQPAQRSLSKGATQECFEDVALMAGEGGETQAHRQLNLEPMGLDELGPEKHFIAEPLACDSEQPPEEEARSPERTLSGGACPGERRFLSLSVTIENHTPPATLPQCLGIRALSEVLECPWEEDTHRSELPVCGQSFSDGSPLSPHQKTHPAEKKHACAECGKLFSHRATLRVHTRIHTGEKPYQCSVCGTCFRQHAHLSRHMNVHAEKKPYCCGVCGRGFLWLFSLAQHLKVHAARSCRRCPHCGQVFTQKARLALHVKAHASAIQNRHGQCPEQPSYLSLPERTDAAGDLGGTPLPSSPTKTLQCPECLAAFPTLSELRPHQSTHSTPPQSRTAPAKRSHMSLSKLLHQEGYAVEKPFQCAECGKSFRLYMHLGIHQRVHAMQL